MSSHISLLPAMPIYTPRQIQANYFAQCMLLQHQQGRVQVPTWLLKTQTVAIAPAPVAQLLS